MKDRIKEVRTHYRLKQSEFAERLGLTRNYISLVENGTRSLSDGIVLLLCKEFHVNETWLRTGEGEMFAPTTRNQAIAQKAAELFNNPELADIVLNTNANELKGSKARFIKFISALDDKRLDMVEQIMIDYVKNLEEEQKPPAD